jgi:ABC-type nitrate/sulfonate/bicarbonate transport system permease component
MTAGSLSAASWPRPNLTGLATLVGCVLAWEGAIRAGIVTFAYLPAPSAIARGAGELMATGELPEATLHTLTTVFAGWTAAVVTGVPLGLVIGSSPLLRRYTLATIEVLRPLPAIAFVPVALLRFGFSIETELVVVILPCLWPVLIATLGGVRDVHERLIDVGRTLRLSRAAVVARIVLPAATPAILVGMRLSLTLAVVLAVLAEMVGNPAGLGYGVVAQQQALRPDLMFVYVVVIGVIGLTLNALLVAVVTPGSRRRP